MSPKNKMHIIPHCLVIHLFSKQNGTYSGEIRSIKLKVGKEVVITINNFEALSKQATTADMPVDLQEDTIPVSPWPKTEI